MAHPGGRPTVMTEKVLQVLETAFSYGATDTEASFQAGISPRALYEYCQAHPEFAQRKEGLKEETKYIARRNVSKKVRAGDNETSKWYLERKAKDEFSTKSETDLTSGGEKISFNIINYAKRPQGPEQDQTKSKS